jgi:hypothetical protein
MIRWARMNGKQALWIPGACAVLVSHANVPPGARQRHACVQLADVPVAQARTTPALRRSWLLSG